MTATLKKQKLEQAIKACTANADGLRSDAELLLDWERYGTSYGLAVLAAEEHAKAFILRLVCDGTVPWSVGVRRALTCHVGKQLVGVIMSWLPSWDEALEEDGRIHKWVMAGFPDEPVHPSKALATAINLWRYGTVEGERFAWLDWLPDDRDPQVRQIFDGRFDRMKQDAFFVRLGTDGSVGSKPSQFTKEHAQGRLAQIDRVANAVIAPSPEYQWLRKILRLMFEEIEPCEVVHDVIPGVVFKCYERPVVDVGCHSADSRDPRADILASRNEPRTSPAHSSEASEDMRVSRDDSGTSASLPGWSRTHPRITQGEPRGP